MRIAVAIVFSSAWSDRLRAGIPGGPAGALGLALSGSASTAQALTILYQHTLTRPTLTDPPITFFDPRLMLFEPIRTAITTDIAHEFQDLESNCIANEGC